MKTASSMNLQSFGSATTEGEYHILVLHQPSERCSDTEAQGPCLAPLLQSKSSAGTNVILAAFNFLSGIQECLGLRIALSSCCTKPLQTCDLSIQEARQEARQSSRQPMFSLLTKTLLPFQKTASMQTSCSILGLVSDLEIACVLALLE